MKTTLRRIAGPLVLVTALGVGGCASTNRSAFPAVVAGQVEPTSEPWTFEGRSGLLLKTQDFRIFTTLPQGSTLDRIPAFLETALDHYTSVIGALPRPRSPLETYVMRRREQWASLTQRLMGDDASTYLRIQRGGFTAKGKAVLFYIGPRDTFAIAAHEGWHQYTQSTFREALPIWLEEGLATYMEGFRWDRDDPRVVRFMPWANTERFDALREAAEEGRLVPLAKLLSSVPQDLMSRQAEDALQYYAQVWALTQFLAEGEGGRYRAALHEMVHDAADGKLTRGVARVRGSRAASAFTSTRRGTDVLLAYTEQELPTLEAQYARFVDEVVRVGNKQRIVGGLSPVGAP